MILVYSMGRISGPFLIYRITICNLKHSLFVIYFISKFENRAFGGCPTKVCCPLKIHAYFLRPKLILLPGLNMRIIVNSAWVVLEHVTAHTVAAKGIEY